MHYLLALLLMMVLRNLLHLNLVNLLLLYLLLRLRLLLCLLSFLASSFRSCRSLGIDDNVRRVNILNLKNNVGYEDVLKNSKPWSHHDFIPAVLSGQSLAGAEELWYVRMEHQLLSWQVAPTAQPVFNQIKPFNWNIIKIKWNGKESKKVLTVTNSPIFWKTPFKLNKWSKIPILWGLNLSTFLTIWPWKVIYDLQPTNQPNWYNILTWKYNLQSILTTVLY